jgi:hypothetical protein
VDNSKTVDYSKPEIVDYGTLEELTAGSPQIGTEDGGNKFHRPFPAS